MQMQSRLGRGVSRSFLYDSRRKSAEPLIRLDGVVPLLEGTILASCQQRIRSTRIPHDYLVSRKGHMSAKDPRRTAKDPMERISSPTSGAAATSSNGRSRRWEILHQHRQRFVDRHTQLTFKQATMELNAIVQFWLDSCKEESLSSSVVNAQPTSAAAMWQWVAGMMPRLQPNFVTYRTLIDGIKAVKDPKQRDIALAELLLKRMVDLAVQGSGSKESGSADQESSLAAKIASAQCNPIQASHATNALDMRKDLSIGVTYAFHIVMTMYCQVQEVAAAERLLRELERLSEAPMSAATGIAVTPDSYSIVLSGWAQRGAPREAEYVLNSMMNRAMRGGSKKSKHRIFPTKVHFESCLNAWVKASSNPVSGQRAELLLLKMQELHEKRRDTKPCVKSFAKVVAAWVNSKHKDATVRADAIVHIMNEIDWSHESDTVSFQTTVANTHYQVMKLWSWSDLPYAPEKCRALLGKLDQLVGYPNIHPVMLQRLYAALITAWARSGRSEMVTKAEGLLSELQAHVGVPGTVRFDFSWDAAVYHSMLQVYAKSGDGERAEAILKRMSHEYLSTRRSIDGWSTEPTIVDTKALNSVLLAWSRSSDPTAANRAESLFLQMQQLHNGDHIVMKPDVVSYNALLAALSGSADEKVARRGMQYLQQMKDEATCRPTTVTYTKAILLWSNIHTTEALEQAQALLDEMCLGEHSIQPDWTTYRAFLSVLKGCKLSEPVRSHRIVEIQSKLDQLVARRSSNERDLNESDSV